MPVSLLWSRTLLSTTMKSATERLSFFLQGIVWCMCNDEGEPTEFSVSIGGLSFETKRKALRKAGTDEIVRWSVCVPPLAVMCQACAKFGEVVTVRRWVRGAPRRADVSFSSAEEMEAAIQGMEGKDSAV